MPPRRAPSTDEDDATPYFDTVDELQQHGINVQDILKLKARFSRRVSCFCPLICLPNQGSSFATGVEIQDKRKRVIMISTGSKSVDGILGVYGEFRTGKTQLAHTMSVVTQLPPDLGGASGKVFIFPSPLKANPDDIPGTFRPDRIKSIADSFWQNITIRWKLINECSLRFAEDKDFRLLIVDSIMALFRTDFSGRGELSERQQKMLSKLTKLSEEYNPAFLLLNSLVADPGATMTFVAGGALKPIGGHILSHASATRMFLRKGNPDRPESEASYKLDEGGWRT
ncbi:Rad51-domain-containing protein, partial [Mycena olivaceomarginata]